MRLMRGVRHFRIAEMPSGGFLNKKLSTGGDPCDLQPHVSSNGTWIGFECSDDPAKRYITVLV